MFLELIEEENIRKTKIRCTKKEWGTQIPTVVQDAIKKLAIESAQNRRFITFVLDGDYLNKGCVSKEIRMGDTREEAECNKCGNCRYLDKIKRSSIGYECHRPDWEWRSRTAHLKNKYTKACKAYVKAEV